MNEFEYVMALMAIVLGLGTAHLLAGFGKIIYPLGHVDEGAWPYPSLFAVGPERQASLEYVEALLLTRLRMWWRPGTRRYEGFHEKVCAVGVGPGRQIAVLVASASGDRYWVHRVGRLLPRSWRSWAAQGRVSRLDARYTDRAAVPAGARSGVRAVHHYLVAGSEAAELAGERVKQAVVVQ